MIYLRWEVTHRSRIKWFDDQGDYPVTAKVLGYRTPAGWDKTVEAVLAHHVTTRMGLYNAASQLHSKAAARMAAHRDTGAARVGIEAHDLDYIVYLEDGDPGHSDSSEGRSFVGPSSDRSGKRSALSIEFGHRTRGGGRVGGLYIITGAVNGAARNPKKRWDR